MTHQLRPSSARWPLAATLTLLLSTGCSSISTETVDPEKLAQQAHESALYKNEVSDSTARILRLTLLDELASHSPERAMRSLIAMYEQGDGPWESIEPLTSAAELALLHGRRLETEDPAAAAGYFLAAAELGQSSALRAHRGDAPMLSPQPRFAAELYNFSVGRLVDLLHGPLQAFSAPSDLLVEGPFGTYRIELLGDLGVWDASLFQLVPADQIQVQGLKNRHRGSGLGAPMVARLAELPERLLPENGLLLAHAGFYGVTANVVFEEDPRPPAEARSRDERGRHRRVRVQLFDPLETRRFELDGVSVPLEADFTAPLAVLNEVVEPRASGAAATFRSEKYIDEIGLTLFEPYRTDKIPVVLVHGLQSNAVTWITMINGLRANPELRQSYQLWAFNYPTGLPFTLSASLLRETLLKAVRQLDPELKNPRLDRMVIIGHSMGGLVSRLQVTHSGENLWRAVSDYDLDSLEASEEDLKLLRDTLFTEPLPWLSRAVFMATPHQGSRLASGGLGRFVSSLVQIPGDLALRFSRLSAAGVFHSDRPLAESEAAPNSVSSLSPENPLFAALRNLPPQVPFHSVVADLPLVNDEIVSDGVVEGWSAVLGGAASQKIVKSTHGVHRHPEGIAEIRRILKLHLEEEAGDGKSEPAD